MEIIKNYHSNHMFRNSFNELAQKIFGLNFEDWYQNGYWKDKYIPYSVVEEEKVIANVSVNLMDMLWNGSIVHLIQLGTVMAEESYRNQGLIRKIMEQVEADYKQVDGIYLFANDSVLDFYPKFGYRKVPEYQYSKQVNITEEARVKTLSMGNKQEWNVLEKVIQNNQFHGQFDMVDNMELFMFYVTKFMQENVYYDELLKAYVIAEVEQDEVLIHAVFSEHKVDINDIIQSFGNTIKKVILGFTPEETEGYECSEVQEEDTTLFVKGSFFDNFAEKRLMFPTLSHA